MILGGSDEEVLDSGNTSHASRDVRDGAQQFGTRIGQKSDDRQTSEYLSSGYPFSALGNTASKDDESQRRSKRPRNVLNNILPHNAPAKLYHRPHFQYPLIL